jgi:hypothetical protein
MLVSVRLKKNRVTRAMDVYATMEENGRRCEVGYCTMYFRDSRMECGYGSNPRIYKMMKRFRTGLKGILEPVCNEFQALNHKIMVSTGGNTFLVYPRFAAYVFPNKYNLRRVEKLTRKTDDFVRRYAKPALETQLDRIFQDGVRLVAKTMHSMGTATDLARTDASKNGQYRYEVEISVETIRGDSHELEKTVIHELVHLNFSRNGTPMMEDVSERLGFNRSKKWVEEYVTEMETDRIMRGSPLVVQAARDISTRLKSEPDFVVRS